MASLHTGVHSLLKYIISNSIFQGAEESSLVIAEEDVEADPEEDVEPTTPTPKKKGKSKSKAATPKVWRLNNLKAYENNPFIFRSPFPGNFVGQLIFFYFSGFFTLVNFCVIVTTILVHDHSMSH